MYQSLPFDANFFSLLLRIDRDLAGHQATASLTYETRQDLTAPDLALTSPADGALLASGTVQVTGTVTDAGMVASVVVNGEPATLDAGASPPP